MHRSQGDDRMHTPGMLRSPGMLDHREMMGCTCSRDPQVSWDARPHGDDGMHRFSGMHVTGRCYGGYRPD